MVRFSVLALLLFSMVGGASAVPQAYDDFEDGDYTSNPSWNDFSSQGSISVQSSIVYDGSNSLLIDSVGFQEGLRYDRGTGSISDGDLYQTAFRVNDSSETIPFYAVSTQTDFSTGPKVRVQSDTNGDLRCINSDGDFTNKYFGSVSSNTWYKFEFVLYPSNNTQVCKQYDDNRDLIDSVSIQPSSMYSNLNYVGLISNSDVKTWFDVSSYSTSEQNNPPQFNSTSINPDPPLIGESVSYGAEVYDSDGNVDYTNLSLEYGGSTMLSDAQRTGTISPVWNDVFTPQTGNKWLNATLSVVDDAGAVTTQEINRYLSNDAPAVTINKPGNSTFWSYSVPLEFSVSDSDSNPGETLYCEVYQDGSLDRNLTGLSESDSYSGSLSSDLGGHTVSVECSDPAGNTDIVSESYTVNDFEINSVSSQSDVYETTDVGYSLDYRTGDMINQANSEIILTWNGSSQSHEFNLSSSEDALETVQKTIPLIKSNNSNYNWDIEARYNASKINGVTEIRSKTSDTKSQAGLQAYKFNQHELKDGFTQLEASDLEYTASINKLEGSAGGAFTGETTFSQTNKTKLLNEDSGLVFSNTFESLLINSSSSSFNLETVLTLSFDGDTRQIVDSKSVQLDKIVLDKTTGEQTLSIETRDEVNNSLQNSNLEMGLQVNNPDSPDRKRFYGFEFSNSDTHSISIQPSYAEVTANAFQKRNIDYQNQDLEYPKRRHFLIDETLNNETTQIDLYMLKNSEAQNVEFELLDADLNPLEQHVIRIERAFPNLEETRTVAMVKTGSEGLANTFVDVEEQYIFTVFDSDGNLKDQIGPQSITGLTTTLEIDPELPPGLDNLKRQVRFTDVQENNDNLVVDYISETERLNNIYLTAKKDNLFNTEIIDTDSSTQPQGQLEVTGFNASNESVYYNLIGTFGDSNVTLDSGRYGTDSGSYGDTGMFMSLIFILALIISGLFRPSAAIGMGVIGIFVLSFIGFLPIGQTALISIAVLGAILVWRMS